ncbi:hypothetical protein [Psychrobacillus sp. MER TA 171]|uniref:hypothetical protein n=1 Tax=Psychrobacillus sp. MER TA 171 TaxID=2939577 RepID=UPI00203A6F4C|nr:hypothetical protein [Psychrobacillus sp. MER TA 171]MCM3357737.1 hypothetical protein [Psychrobacillus sp. MER TA 171]
MSYFDERTILEKSLKHRRELSNKKSASAYLCPDRQMEKSEEAVPQPPELLSI